MKSRTIRRQAFTLVELMISIAIVGLLIAMLTDAIYKGLMKAKEARNRIDITQMEVSLEQFKQRFGVYPPSRLMLCENAQYYFNPPGSSTYANQLAQDSLAFLQKMFPGLDSSSSGLWWNVGINWSGNKDPGTGAD